MCVGIATILLPPTVGGGCYWLWSKGVSAEMRRLALPIDTPLSHSLASTATGLGVLADLPTCLEGADPVDADGVLEQFCFDVSIDVTVPRERCMEVPSVSFNGTETGGTETACSQVLVTEVEVVQECHDYVTLDRSYEMVNARPASDLVAKYTEPASTLVSRVRTLLRSKQLQPLLKAVRTGLQVASLL